MKKYSVLAPLEPVSSGFNARKYPPHITLSPPFKAERGVLSQVIDTLHEVAEDHMPIRANIGPTEMFGPKNETLVRRVGGSMFGVHIGVVCALIGHGAELDHTFTGVDGWNPHITDHEGLSEEDQFKIERFYLFVSSKGVKKVVQEFSGPDYGQGSGLSVEPGVQ